MLVKVTEMDSDTCGNSSPGVVFYVSCINIHEVEAALEHKVAKGLRHWNVEVCTTISVKDMVEEIKEHDDARRGY